MSIIQATSMVQRTLRGGSGTGRLRYRLRRTARVLAGDFSKTQATVPRRTRTGQSGLRTKRL